MAPLNSFNYSIPYLFFLSILIILYWLSCLRKNNPIFPKYKLRLLVITLFSLFWGFRGYVCTDWVNYYQDFTKCPPIYSINQWIQFYRSNFTDIGFLIYIGLFKILITDYLLFQLSLYLIILYYIDKCINIYSKDYILSFIMVIVFFTVQSINTVRNGIAIILFIYSIKFIYENKIYNYAVYNIIGICFHKTSVLLLFLYFIIKKQYKVKYLIIIFILAYLVMILQLSFISQYAENIIGETSGRVNYVLQYLKNTSFKLVSIGNIERLITTILVLKYYKSLWDRYKYGGYFANIMILYLLTNLILFEISTVAVRIAQLFSFAYVIFYPYILDIVRNDRCINFYRAAIISYVIMWSSITFGQLMYQYDNFATGFYKTYEERMILYNYYGPAKYVGVS